MRPATFGTGSNAVSPLQPLREPPPTRLDLAAFVELLKSHDDRAVLDRLKRQPGLATLADLDGNTTALHHAARYGCSGQVVEALVQAGADPNSWVHNAAAGFGDGRYADTPLVLAATDGHRDTVKALLRAGAEPDLMGANRDTALLRAARNGHRAVIDILVTAGAKLDYTDQYGEPALILAATGGHRDAIEALLSAGAKADAKGQGGDTALIRAAANGHCDAIAALLRGGASIEATNHHGDTPLISAAARGHRKAIDVLLAAGAKLEAKGGNGNTPLIRAAANGQDESIDALLEADANLEAKNRDGDTALVRAVSAYWGNRPNIKIIGALLKKGANPNAKGKDGNTALHHAARLGNCDIIHMLLEADADIEATNNLGRTALHCAAEAAYGGRRETIAALLAKGANLDARDRAGNTALILAVGQSRSTHRETVDALLHAYAAQGFTLSDKEQEALRWKGIPTSTPAQIQAAMASQNTKPHTDGAGPQSHHTPSASASPPVRLTTQQPGPDSRAELSRALARIEALDTENAKLRVQLGQRAENERLLEQRLDTVMASRAAAVGQRLRDLQRLRDEQQQRVARGQTDLQTLQAALAHTEKQLQDIQQEFATVRPEPVRRDPNAT